MQATSSVSDAETPAPSTSQKLLKPKFTYQSAHYKLKITIKDQDFLVSEIFQSKKKNRQLPVNENRLLGLAKSDPSYLVWKEKNANNKIQWLTNNAIRIFPIPCDNKVILEEKNSFFLSLLNACAVNINREDLASHLFSLATSLRDTLSEVDAPHTIHHLHQFESLPKRLQQETLSKSYWVLTNIHFERGNFKEAIHFHQMFLTTIETSKSRVEFNPQDLGKHPEYLLRIGIIFNKFKDCFDFSTNFDLNSLFNKPLFDNEALKVLNIVLNFSPNKIHSDLNKQALPSLIEQATALLEDDSTVLNSKKIEILNEFTSYDHSDIQIIIFITYLILFEIHSKKDELLYNTDSYPSNLKMITDSFRRKKRLGLFFLEHKKRKFIRGSAWAKFELLYSMITNFDINQKNQIADLLPELFLKAGKILLNQSKSLPSFMYVDLLKASLKANQHEKALFPDVNYQCHNSLGSIYQCLGIYDRAIHHYSQASNYNSNKEQSKFIILQTLRSKNYLNTLNQLIKKGSKRLFARNKISYAKIDFDDFSIIKPLNQIYEYLHNLRYEETINYCESILKQFFIYKDLKLDQMGRNDLNFIDHIYHLMSIAFFMLKKYENAIEIYQQLLKHVKNAPQLIHIYSFIGYCYFQMAQYDLTEKNLKKALKIDSKFPLNFFSLDEQEIAVARYQEISKIYLLLEEIELEKGKKIQALEKFDNRLSQILVNHLSKKLDLGESQNLTVQDIIFLATELSVTFVSYSLSQYQTESPRIHVWVISPLGKVNHVEIDAKAFQDHFGRIQEFYDNISAQVAIKTRTVSEIFSNGPSSSSYLNLSPHFEPETPSSATALSTTISEISLPSSSSVPSSSENFDFASQPTASSSTSSSVVVQTRAFKQSNTDMYRAKKLITDEKLLKDFQEFWYDILIKPIEDFLPKNPHDAVTIIPEGCLYQIPFAALHNSQTKQYLIEMHPISFAPSLKTLDLQHRLATRRGENPPSGSLAIGNPYNDKVRAPNGERLNSLELAEKEAIKVTELLNEPSSHLFLNKEATVAKFKQTAPNVRWIFAGCHGQEKCKPEDDLYSVFEGELVLTPDGEEYSYSNGKLNARDISKLDLKAELVFLSACYSGTGNIQQEGVMGNIWSFLSAGALSTVSTYWPLPDLETTKDMVETFYRHILGKSESGFKLNKAQALQQATLQAMREVGRENIKQWGAFFLTGLIDVKE